MEKRKMMDRKLKYGETYFYIDNKGEVVCRRNTLQDIDILNGMRMNYYFTEAEAKLKNAFMKIDKKEKEQ
jgi:hypothetical protein